MPSRVMTSAWPCDSPAVRNLSIRPNCIAKKLQRSGRLHADLRVFSHAQGHCSAAVMTRLLHDRYVMFDERSRL